MTMGRFSRSKVNEMTDKEREHLLDTLWKCNRVGPAAETLWSVLELLWRFMGRIDTYMISERQAEEHGFPTDEEYKALFAKMAQISEKIDELDCIISGLHSQMKNYVTDQWNKEIRR